MKKEKLMKIQERLVFLLIFLFLLPIGVIAQQKMITGQVVDEQGEAVIGASVMVKGAKTGTITDLDGNFFCSGKSGANAFYKLCWLYSIGCENYKITKQSIRIEGKHGSA